MVLKGRILHDWNLPTKKFLFGKAYEAVPSGGARVVYEASIDDARSANSFGLLMRLNKLVETTGIFFRAGVDCAN